MRILLLLIFILSNFILFSQELMITDGSLDFKNNSIEKAYQREKNYLNTEPLQFSTAAWIELEIKYTEIWDKELNQFYKKLLNKIDSERSKIIIESQKTWLAHYNKESLFLYKLLIEDFMNGSGGQALYYVKLLEEKRKRVYELIEYYYMFGGEIKYLFDTK